MKQTVNIAITAFLFIFFGVVMAYAADTYKLPDTGIDNCYNIYGNIVECAPEQEKDFYRQDAHYNGPKMAYQSGSEGKTITDSNTQLMWQKEDDGAKRKWQAACDYCDDLELAGYSDWRLPERNELFSIVDLGKSNPAVNPIFANTKSSSYWSKSPNSNGTGNAWYVNFTDGYVGTYGTTNGGYARCVRSVKLTPSYKDNGDGTITDLNTGLMWQKSDDGEKRTWEEALEYSEDLTLGKYSDWRLPNIRELETIVDLTTYSPAINQGYFTVGLQNSGYWSGSSYISGAQGAWALYSGSGVVYARKKDYTNSVRCVRSGTSEPLSFVSIKSSETKISAKFPVTFSVEATGGLSPYTYTYSWDFGDNTAYSNEQNPSHSYANPGNYIVTCTIKDESGQTTSGKLTVQVESAGMRLQIHQVDTAGYNTIKNLVSVIDGNGNIIKDLTKSNFSLFEDNNPGTIDSVTYYDSAVSISLVLDYSGSMGSSTPPLSQAIDDLQSAASDFLNYLEANDLTQIIKFDSSVEVIQDFTIDKKLLLDAINNHPYGGGGTALYDAIHQSVTETDALKGDGRKIVIAMTDGSSNSDQYNETDVIAHAKDKNIPVYTIGLGSGIDSSTLQNIADGTGGTYYRAPDSSELKAIYQEIASTVLHPYVIEYKTGSADAVEHNLKIEVDYSGVKKSDSVFYSIPCAYGYCPSIKMPDETTGCLSSVSLDLDLDTNGNQIASVSADITYDSSLLEAPSATIGAEGSNAGKEVVIEEVASDSDSGSLKTFRIGVVSKEDSHYESIIQSGVVASVRFSVVSTVSSGASTVLTIKTSEASNSDGNRITVEGNAGTIDFGSCCLGDCDGINGVEESEVTAAYDQFLGVSPPSGCNDRNGDGVISINELQSIIINFLEKTCSKK
ncbi:MAG: VWA domain-containing protein [Desulfamplus sp.]|nr:VWA domain-containing protein [Desulfamplus sp.]